MLSLSQPLAAFAVAMTLTTGASATVNHCPSGATNVCFAVGVPDATASSGSGNIYFQITAPTSYQWVALGSGSMMADSNIFIMYQDGAGNVTVSPRLGANHVMPTLDTSSTAAKLTLLSGSGVADNMMTANVMCSNCESWGSSGKLSLTSTAADWIAAWKSGSSLATTNKAASLSQHDNTDQYTLDLTKATISSDSNPFTDGNSSSGSGSDSGSSSGSGSGSSGGSGSGGGAYGGGSGSSGSGSSSSGGSVTSPKHTILVAHAVVMCIVMVALYPLGSALMPLVGNWALHGTWQGVSYLLMWAGFALGVIAGKQRQELYLGPALTHTALGTVVVAAMGIQPGLGLLHHRHYVRNQSRGFVSYFHIWFGRALMVMGIVNGGLGLKLSNESRSAIIGYSVGSAVLFLTYVVAKVAGNYWLADRRAAKTRGVVRSGSGSAYAYPPPPNQPESRRQHKSTARSNSRSNGYTSSSSQSSPPMQQAGTGHLHEERRY